MDEKARVTVSPGWERLQDDLLRSVLVLAQVAKFLRLFPTVHYQQAPPLQEPDGEEMISELWREILGGQHQLQNP